MKALLSAQPTAAEDGVRSGGGAASADGTWTSSVAGAAADPRSASETAWRPVAVARRARAGAVKAPV